MRVRDWMTPEPVTVTPQTSVMNARRILRAQGIRHLPVVEGDRVVGMLSDADLLRLLDEAALQPVERRPPGATLPA